MSNIYTINHPTELDEMINGRYQNHTGIELNSTLVNSHDEEQNKEQIIRLCSFIMAQDVPPKLIFGKRLSMADKKVVSELLLLLLPSHLFRVYPNIMIEAITNKLTDEINLLDTDIKSLGQLTYFEVGEIQQSNVKDFTHFYHNIDNKFKQIKLNGYDIPAHWHEQEKQNYLDTTLCLLDEVYFQKKSIMNYKKYLLKNEANKKNNFMLFGLTKDLKNKGYETATFQNNQSQFILIEISDQKLSAKAKQWLKNYNLKKNTASLYIIFSPFLDKKSAQNFYQKYNFNQYGDIIYGYDFISTISSLHEIPHIDTIEIQNIDYNKYENILTELESIHDKKDIIFHKLYCVMLYCYSLLRVGGDIMSRANLIAMVETAEEILENSHLNHYDKLFFQQLVRINNLQQSITYEMINLSQEIKHIIILAINNNQGVIDKIIEIAIANVSPNDKLWIILSDEFIDENITDLNNSKDCFPDDTILFHHSIDRTLSSKVDKLYEDYLLIMRCLTNGDEKINDYFLSSVSISLCKFLYWHLSEDNKKIILEGAKDSWGILNDMDEFEKSYLENYTLSQYEKILEIEKIDDFNKAMPTTPTGNFSFSFFLPLPPNETILGNNTSPTSSFLTTSQPPNKRARTK